MKKILIIHTHGIGDWILFTPALRFLLEEFPEYKIDVITALEPTRKFILEYKKVNILKNYNFRKGNLEYLKFLYEINSLKYDIVILNAGYHYWKLQLISLMLLRNSKVLGLIEKKRINLFLKNPVYYETTWHKSRINFELINYLVPHKKIEIKSNLISYIPNDNFSATISNDIVIHPGCDSANKYRRWPIENFYFIIKKLLEKNFKVNVILGPSESDLVNEFEDFKNNLNFKLHNSVSFLELFTIISKNKLVLANDSAIGHIGGGLNKNVISIFGPADPNDTCPLGNKVQILVPQIKLDCMPCAKVGGKFGCLEQTCLKSIDKNLVLNLVLNTLNNL